MKISLLYLLLNLSSGPPLKLEAQPPTAVQAGIADSPQVAAIVARYKARLGEKLSTVIAQTEQEISAQGEPSSPLGILVADLLLAQLKAQEPKIQAFFTNDGGLRASLSAGPIQLGQVYEVMPFDNELVLLELDGVHLQAIADQIARKRGEPIAGAQMRLDPALGRASEVKIMGQALDPQARYLIGTSDYLAEAGWMSEIVKDLPLKRTGILMRDAIAEGLKASTHTIKAKLDDRLSFK